MPVNIGTASPAVMGFGLTMDALPKRKKLPHDRPAWISEESIYFVTVCCEPRGKNQLCHSDIAEKVFEAVNFRQARNEWWVNLFVLMPDHAHGLIMFPRHVNMRKVVGEWKESTARRAGICWQRDFFDHRLRDDENHVAKAHYIRMNPVRKGLADKPENWPYVWEEKAAGQGCPALPEQGMVGPDSLVGP